MLYKSNLTIEPVVANYSGAMEADTILKNAASSKSLMSREKMFLINSLGAIAMAVIMFSMVACGSGSGKIPNGTYCEVGNDSRCITFSGGNFVEWGSMKRTYIIKGDEINLLDESGDVSTYRFIRDGDKLIMIIPCHNKAGHYDYREVYTKR